jgi:hypothetical protein
MEPLHEVYSALLEEARDGVSGAAYGPPAAEAGPLYEGLVDSFQGLAICNLLLDYNAEQFRTDLVFAAGARRQFLQICQRDGAPAPQCAVSRTEALFCALAARADVLAGDLVRLGPPEWVGGAEYEDDFCYHALLSHAAVPEQAGGLPPPDALLARFAAVLEDGTTPRLEVCRALAAADPTAFRLAFDGLLVERAAWADELYPARRDQPLFLVARHVFVEGLALLALADARGWPMADAYAFCPEPGRLAPAPTPADLFLDVAPFIRESRRQRGLPA